MNRMTTAGHNLDLLQHLEFSRNITIAVAVLRGGGRELALMPVVKLVHVTLDKVPRSKVRMFTENVYWYFENNSSKQTLSKERTEFLLERITGGGLRGGMLNTYPKS